MEYLPFGETLVEEHLNSHNSPYKFNAKELDEETGWYYYGARYYDPKWSIWLSVDPMAEKFPGWSSYVYTHNNPLRYTDPTGMSADDVIINGEHTQKAFEELQASVAGQLELSKKDDGTVTYKIAENGGAPLTKGAQQLVDAIDDSSVVVNVNATDTKDVGVFMGNKTDENGIVQTKQKVDPNLTSIVDNASEDYGGTMLHEVVESYLGGKEAKARGVKSVRQATREDRFDEGSIFYKAHTEAPQPVGKIFYDKENKSLYTKAKKRKLEYRAKRVHITNLE